MLEADMKENKCSCKLNGTSLVSREYSLITSQVPVFLGGKGPFLQQGIEVVQPPTNPDNKERECTQG